MSEEKEVKVVQTKEDKKWHRQDEEKCHRISECVEEDIGYELTLRKGRLNDELEKLLSDKPGELCEGCFKDFELHKGRSKKSR